MYHTKSNTTTVCHVYYSSETFFRQQSRSKLLDVALAVKYACKHARMTALSRKKPPTD
jgi:hypothetical protein